MPGFTSLDDFITETTVNGKSAISSFIRTINTGATSAAGSWHDTFSGGGTGGTGVLTGTAGLGTAMSASTAGAIPFGAGVLPDLRYVTRFSAQAASATAVPGVILLTDLLYIYPSCTVTAPATTLSNAAARPARFGSGAGVQASAIVASALGAATPLLTLTYTNSSGTGSRTGRLSAAAVSHPVGRLLSGTATAGTLAGPYMTTDTGDVGVQQIDSYAITSGGTTGTVSFVLHRPILEIPLIAANAPAFESYIGADMPQIDDDSCLAMFVLVGGALVAAQTITGSMRHAWG